MASALESSVVRAVLLIPRVKADEVDKVTFAPVSQKRGQRPDRIEFRVPSRSASATLQRLGMHDLSTTIEGRSSREVGAFLHLPWLGMTAAFFGDERDYDRAAAELANEYDFVPNFTLSLPHPVEAHAALESRPEGLATRFEWPAETGIAEAHRLGLRGAGVLLGVLDTGVDSDHDEFAHRLITYRYVSFFPQHPDWPPRDVRGFDIDGHGTHVCGIAAGRNVGVAPGRHALRRFGHREPDDFDESRPGGCRPRVALLAVQSF